MRRILVEHACRQGRLKRDGGWGPSEVPLEGLAAAGPDTGILALDEALTLTGPRPPPKAELVRLRYFAGLTLAEAA
jgi:hypothetical protein